MKTEHKTIPFTKLNAKRETMIQFDWRQLSDSQYIANVALSCIEIKHNKDSNKWSAYAEGIDIDSESEFNTPTEAKSHAEDFFLNALEDMTRLTRIFITNNDGITFLARLVAKGQTLTTNDNRTHDSEDPVVEIFDTRHPHTKFGQFVSRHCLSTIIETETGMLLAGHVDEWTISDQNVFEIQQAFSQKK